MGLTFLGGGSGGGGGLDSTAVLALVKTRERTSRVFDPRDYGAKVDGMRLTDLTVPNGAATPQVSSPTYTFTSADVGKIIGIELPIGTTRDAWVTSIVSVTGGVATLASNAPAATVVAGPLECVFGTNDDAAVAAAQDAAYAATSYLVNGGTVRIPSGRMCVQATLILKDFVSWVGQNRETDIVSVIKDADSATVSTQTSWLVSHDPSPGAPLTGCTFKSFKIEGRFHTKNGYSSNVKPLNIYNVKRVFVVDMWMDRTPTTSIPCDQSTDACIIANNLITSPGRMNSGTVPGGSGVGMGTAAAGQAEPTLIIGNVILGDGARGVNGIFTEGQVGSTATTAPVGYRIINNYISKMRYGITGAGSRGMVISGNVVNQSMMAGIQFSGGTLTSGFLDEDFLIEGNTVCNGVLTGQAGATGHGILVDVGSDDQTSGRGLIVNNQVFGNQGVGILVQTASTVNARSVTIRNNYVRRNGRSGIAFGNPTAGTAIVRQATVEGNTCVGNGTRNQTGDTLGILLATVMTDCVINGNVCYDDQTTQTQTYGLRVHPAGVMTGGQIRGNDCRGNLTGTIQIQGTVSATTWLSDNPGHTPPAPAAVTVTASPMTYTAPVIPTTLYINGGTLTALTIGGTAIDPATKALALQPGDAVVLTYSTAPTLASRAA